ncbi:hypothetical protein AGR3A_Cc170161 [Agrobacterium tomkonis CFBP 6623]|uniref:Uncharacterized protein n=1 Tax=Agrobacterium tomkonis CFBP 6623 TaxID=1183432 RepID=A0A1S7NVP5_9HYPH|nr:hypothetical protein AGR3A_Cc170161 [Agrobacterium tomkonis CFBP 6623]
MHDQEGGDIGIIVVGVDLKETASMTVEAPPHHRVWGRFSFPNGHYGLAIRRHNFLRLIYLSKSLGDADQTNVLGA